MASVGPPTAFSRTGARPFPASKRDRGRAVRRHRVGVFGRDFEATARITCSCFRFLMMVLEKAG